MGKEREGSGYVCYVEVLLSAIGYFVVSLITGKLSNFPRLCFTTCLRKGPCDTFLNRSDRNALKYSCGRKKRRDYLQDSSSSKILLFFNAG